MKPRTPWARDVNPVGMSGRDPALIEQARRHVREIREFYVNALMFAVVIPVLWAVNLMGTPKVLWAQWPTLGWGFGVLIHGLFIFGGRSLFGTEWEERKVEGGGTVEVRAVREAYRDGNRIVFMVRDDGLGFDLDRKRDEREVGGGVGLANLRERLTVLFDGEATFDIRDVAPGCEARLAIPAHWLESAREIASSPSARGTPTTLDQPESPG